MDNQTSKKVDTVLAELRKMYFLENTSTVLPENKENMTIETIASETNVSSGDEVQLFETRKKRKTKRRRTDTSFTSDTKMASSSEKYESKSALELVVEEVRKIKTEMQLTRNAFLDAMSQMKEKMNEILSGVIEKIETEIIGTIDSNNGEVMKQNGRAVKLEKDVRSHTQSIESATERVNNLDRDVEESIRQERNTRRRLIELEAQERKCNLMFFGVPEKEGTSCNEELSLFMKEHLSIDTPGSLQNTKRVGRVKDNGPRPIVTTFPSSTERLKVWGKRYTIMQPFGISEDFPPEIRKARTSLVPRLKELKRQGKQAGIMFPAILVSNGQIVRRIDIADFIVY